MMSNNDERKKLGKGLKEIIEDQKLTEQIEILQQDTSRTKLYISVTQIRPNPFQPRIHFDDQKLQELADSIKVYGILTPILLRSVDDHYEIVTGERRYRAALLVGLNEVPAILEEFNDEEMMEIALIENIQRENLTPLEEASSYVSMQQKLKLTQQQLAKKMGKSRSYVANVMRLLQLPLEIQEWIHDGKLTVGHARTLIGLPSKEAIQYARQMIEAKTSVREAEWLVAKNKKTRRRKQVEQYEQQFRKVLQRRTLITAKEIKISYQSLEDLEEILQILVEKKCK